MLGRISTLIIGAMLCTVAARTESPCSCGAHPPGPPAPRTLEPYAGAPDDLRPFSHFTKPYYEHYTKIVEYNGAARDAAPPDLSRLSEVRIGFLGPVENHPDEKLGRMMLKGSQLAIDEANAAGGYGGTPFKLMVHNDQAIWGASSNEIVKMSYDERVWAMLGSISGDSTHIALRVSLRSELPIVNSAATDPTIPETLIPWYFTVLQDDRVQGYTLARRIYSDLKLSRIALLRVNDRYGRFGVLKFRDASRRLGHPVVIEQKYMPGDTDFRRQLRVIQDSRVDGVVLWADAAPAGNILKQMREMGMRQPVFGSFRVLGDDLWRNAGGAAEGLQIVYPYDPNRDAPLWLAFRRRFEQRFQAPPDAFASLAYDAMRILLDAVCRAGLNRGRIRDALYGLESFRGVTGEMRFDPNAKNIMPLYLGTVRSGKLEFRRYPMQQPYASVADEALRYAGPPLPDLPAGDLRIALFGPLADQVATRLRAPAGYQLVGIPSEKAWGKSSSELVSVLHDGRTAGLISLDRNSSHLAEQLAVKTFVPLLALSSDRSLTSVNVPWIFRLDPATPPDQALRCFVEAVTQAGRNRERIRALLASGAPLAGLRFDSHGERISGTGYITSK